jgi:hypothetical protein
MITPVYPSVIEADDGCASDAPSIISTQGPTVRGALRESVREAVGPLDNQAGKRDAAAGGETEYDQLRLLGYPKQRCI